MAGNQEFASDAESSDIYAESTPGERSPGKRKSSFSPPDVKRRRRASIHVPPFIWQEIFKHVPPQNLPLLLRTCRLFHTLLTDDTPSDGRQPANNVWMKSRVNHFPGMPEAPGTERSLWNLISGRSCQFCGDAISFGVWMFNVRICKQCLADRTVDELAFVVLDAWSFRAVLPWIFFSDSDGVVSSRDLKNVKIDDIKKLWYKPEIERLTASLDSANSSSRKEILAKQTQSHARSLELCRGWEDWEARRNPTIHQPHPGELHQAFNTGTRTGSVMSLTPTPRLSLSTTSLKGRNLQDALEGKAERRREIERRCLEIEPPITPDILTYMDAFNAAKQISTELTEDSWSHLKPRLLEQRAGAEEKARQVQDIMSSRHETKSVSTQSEWDESQREIRQRISTYADRIILHDWAAGSAVNAHNAADFASHVLRSIRDQYEADRKMYGVLSNSETPAGRRGCPVPRAPLVLDAMKWVFNTKVRPLVEHYDKSLFSCNDCVTQTKQYSFEAVIQHYSSVHNQSFADGGSGVAWKRALWPLLPPFAPDPMHRRTQQKRHSTPRYDYDRLARPPYPPSLDMPSPGSFAYSGYISPHANTPLSYAARLTDTPGSQHTWQTSSVVYPPPVIAPSLYSSQIDFLARIASEIFSLISALQRVPSSVSMHIVIQRSVFSFRSHYSNEPSLDLFADCVAKHPAMSAIKNAQNLACKTCLGDASESALAPRRLYPFLSLLMHFKQYHVERVQHQYEHVSPGGLGLEPGATATARMADWKQDMIELPPIHVIRDVANAGGMDGLRYGFLVDTFPTVFRAAQAREYDPRQPDLMNLDGQRQQQGYNGHRDHKAPQDYEDDRKPSIKQEPDDEDAGAWR